MKSVITCDLEGVIETINTDGEIVTYTPAHFQVVPLALAVMVPRKLTTKKEKLKPIID